MKHHPLPKNRVASLRGMSRALFVAALLLGVVSALPGCYGDAVVATDTRSFTIEHIAGAGITLQTRNGDVIIREVPGLVEVEITAEVYGIGANNGDALRRAQKIDVLINRRGTGQLEIKLDYPDSPYPDEGASFTINVPDTPDVDDIVGVTILNDGGDIDIADLMGTAYLDTSAGRVSVANHTGDVLIQAIYTDVDVSTVNGTLDVYTTRGEVFITDVREEVTVSASNAAVWFEAVPGNAEPFNISTSSAQIEAILPLGTLGTIDAHTSNSTVLISGEGLPLFFPITGSGSSKTITLTPVGPENSLTTTLRPILIDVE